MYEAIVARCFTEKHPNADRLLIGKVLGNTVVVSDKTENGQLGVFFDADGQLSEEFCKINDLYSRLDETGNKVGGFFDDKRKVKAQKFRGVKSDGFFVPLSYFDYTGFDLSSLKEFDKFDELNGHKICEKYFSPATKQKIAREGNKQKEKKKESVNFPKHIETDQFRQNSWKIKVGDVVCLTEKCHGTSFRFAYLECVNEIEYKKYSWKWFKQKLGIFLLSTNEPDHSVFHDELSFRKHYVGSRNIIVGSLEDSQSKIQSYYGDESFRFKVVRQLEGQLKVGEIIYGEILGWVNETTLIMPSADLTKLKDKSLTKRYGNKFYYAYGANKGEAKIFIYRIANQNQDGNLIDLSWEQVKERCKELSLETVPELCSPFVYDGNEEALRENIDLLCEGDSTLDSSHIKEGVCLRIDHYSKPLILKQKSYNFKLLEGIIKEDDSYQDLEEVS